MLRSLVLGAVVVPLLAVLAPYAWGSPALASAAPAGPSDAHPAVVHVGIEIRNLAALDEVKETWQVTGLLIAKWNDPRFRYPGGRGRQYRDLPDTIWKPSFEFTNEVSPSNLRFVDLYARPDGTVVYTQTFIATLSTDLDLRRFPFDSQLLPLEVRARGDDLDSTILKADPGDSPLPKRAYAGLAQWTPISLTERLGPVAGSASDAKYVEFDLKVRRNPKSYVWKFIVPLLLLVIISWVTFWLSHEEFRTKDQLQSAVATLLIIVAFNITASSVIPKTDYITYIDALLFTCFAFVVISIAAIVATHLVQINYSPKGALTLRRLAGALLPFSFLVVQAILFVEFQIAG